MTLRNKRLYHGTSRKIKGDHLTPNISCRVFRNGKTFKRCDRIPKVYTTTNRYLASLWASKVPYINAGLEGDKLIVFLNKKDIIKLKTSGYIYEVDSKGFKRSKRKDYDEYTSNSRSKIIKRVKISNIYMFLKKNPKVELIIQETDKRSVG